MNMRAAYRIAALMAALLVSSAGLAQSIKPFGAQSLEQIQAAHRGKPFVLLVWSMDCEFCQASLEVLSKARAAHPGLDLVTVTTDPIADQVLTGQVRKRLGSLRLLNDPWSFGGDAPERLRFVLDPDWHGEKPRSYWYDAKGQRTAYSGLIKADMLAQWKRRVAD
jgi:hypothetical protein